MSDLKPMLSDEILNKQSKDKQIELLKVDRDTHIAMHNVGDVFMGGAIKCGIMVQAAAQIKAILTARGEQ